MSNIIPTRTKTKMSQYFTKEIAKKLLYYSNQQIGTSKKLFNLYLISFCNGILLNKKLGKKFSYSRKELLKYSSTSKIFFISNALLIFYRPNCNWNTTVFWITICTGEVLLNNLIVYVVKKRILKLNARIM